MNTLAFPTVFFFFELLRPKVPKRFIFLRKSVFADYFFNSVTRIIKISYVKQGLLSRAGLCKQPSSPNAQNFYYIESICAVSDGLGCVMIMNRSFHRNFYAAETFLSVPFFGWCQRKEHIITSFHASELPKLKSIP